MIARLLLVCLAGLGAIVSGGFWHGSGPTYGMETPYAAPIGTFTPINHKGVNIPGGDLFPFPAYPPTYQIDYYASKGFGLIRMPMQPGNVTSPASTGCAPFDLTATAPIKSVLDYAFTKNIYVVFDPHTFGLINSPDGSGGAIAIGATPIATQCFADFWSRIASLFKNYPNAIFGLMNEPSQGGVSATQWAAAAAQAVQAIRATGATQLITVPGIAFTNAWEWTDSGNAAALAGFIDPGNNFVIEAHQYLDGNQGTASFSGTHPQAAPAGIGSFILDNPIAGLLTTWARANHYKVFLGENGFAPDPWLGNASRQMNYDPAATPITTNGLVEGANFYDFMSANSDVFMGWSYWSGAGREFVTPPNTDGYAFDSDPQIVSDGIGGFKYATPIIDQPQMSILTSHLP